MICMIQKVYDLCPLYLSAIRQWLEVNISWGYVECINIAMNSSKIEHQMSS